VAAAGRRSAGATGTRRRSPALGGSGNHRQLKRVVAAAATRAGDLFRLAQDELLKRLAALLANVFVNRHFCSVAGSPTDL
jgi:hypothetical protein